MILVLNFGSQYAHLIARRVRELGVKSEIVPYNVSMKEIIAKRPAGIIFSGSPASVNDTNSLRPDAELLNIGVPILGICYGQHVLAAMSGGVVRSGVAREYGRETFHIEGNSPLFKGLNQQETVWFSNGDDIAILPHEYDVTGFTPACRVAAFQHYFKRIYGIQFHPEVTHTIHGTKILSNFLFEICNVKQDWDLHNFKEEMVASIRETVGDRHVIVGCSGGVDSLVTATLLYQTIGERVHPIFVDTGLLRKGEVEEVQEILHRVGFKKIHIVHAKTRFLSRLRGVVKPEEKRKIIGHIFIEVFENHVRTRLKRYPIEFLAQGTIYPDRIESGEPSKHTSKIKSHHNLTLPRKMRLRVIEPLRELYKDEVRKLGRVLDIPQVLLMRHPSPGIGLAGRIVDAAVTPRRLAMVREADAIFIEELKYLGQYGQIWQAFAALLPMRTVGVMGDARTYEYAIALRAVTSVDGMTADWYRMRDDYWDRIANRIMREVKGVNRVFEDKSSKPPATIEYE